MSCLEICGSAKADKPCSATSHHSVLIKSSLGKLGEDVGAGLRQSYRIPNLTAVRGQDQQLETPAVPDHPFGFFHPYTAPEAIHGADGTCSGRGRGEGSRAWLEGWDKAQEGPDSV